MLLRHSLKLILEEDEGIATSGNEEAAESADKNPVFVEKSRSLAIANLNELTERLDKEALENSDKSINLIDIRPFYKHPTFVQINVRIEAHGMVVNFIIMVATGDMQKEEDNPHRVKWAYIEAQGYDEELQLIGKKLIPRFKFSKINLKKLGEIAKEILDKKGKFVETDIEKDVIKSDKPQITKKL